MNKPSCFGSGDPERCYNREAHDRCEFNDECDEINSGAETKIDYVAFFVDNCEMCGSQRCPADHEAIDSCARNPNSDYAKIAKQIEAWPDWKKEVYNSNFAIGANSKKLIIGDQNMTSNLSGIGENIMDPKSAGISSPYGGVFNPDNTCANCGNRSFCKFTIYYPSLIEKVQEIDVDSNFELRLWCKRYKSDTNTRG